MIEQEEDAYNETDEMGEFEEEEMEEEEVTTTILISFLHYVALERIEFF